MRINIFNSDTMQSYDCKLQMYIFIYPCKKCRKFFLRLLKKNPIANENRNDLIYYFCFLHNQVNLRLNKPIFDCKKAELYWIGKSKCDCPEKEGKKSIEDM